MEDSTIAPEKTDGAVMITESPPDEMETEPYEIDNPGKPSNGDNLEIYGEKIRARSPEKKLGRQDRIELGRMFQAAVNSRDWELSERLILLADSQTLNDTLCIALDSIWFLTTREELDGITGLLRTIVSSGAQDFTRAALRTSFLASCVSACQSSTMSLSETVAIMAQRYLFQLKLISRLI